MYSPRIGFADSARDASE